MKFNYSSDKKFIKLSLWERNDDLIALACLAPDDFDERLWKVGDEFTLKIVGVQKSGWEGQQVQ